MLPVRQGPQWFVAVLVRAHGRVRRYVVRRSAWLLDSVSELDSYAAAGLSIGATYLVSLAFLAAMVEAVLFHRVQRQTIGSLSSNISELERRFQEREHG